MTAVQGSGGPAPLPRSSLHQAGGQMLAQALAPSWRCSAAITVRGKGVVLFDSPEPVTKMALCPRNKLFLLVSVPSPKAPAQSPSPQPTLRPHVKGLRGPPATPQAVPLKTLAQVWVVDMNTLVETFFKNLVSTGKKFNQIITCPMTGAPAVLTKK